MDSSEQGLQKRQPLVQLLGIFVLIPLTALYAPRIYMLTSAIRSTYACPSSGSLASSVFNCLNPVKSFLDCNAAASELLSDNPGVLYNPSPACAAALGPIMSVRFSIVAQRLQGVEFSWYQENISEAWRAILSTEATHTLSPDEASQIYQNVADALESAGQGATNNKMGPKFTPVAGAIQ
ncbi:MAG: hypothetical protein K1X79_05645 [Oligoflexia bacterium]|nr:hypothetical protein [Oligoflexia bacterium]